MLALILTVIFGLGIAYFATQNTNGVTITLANIPLRGVPLYMIVVGSLLIGLFTSWIISLADGISSMLTIHGKDTAIKKAESAITDLKTELHMLELENARLKGEHNEQLESESVEEVEQHVVQRPRFFSRVLGRFAKSS